MARYIDADKFAERIRLSPAFKKMAFEGDLLQRVVLDILGNAPTADVVEVKHGEWVKRQKVYGIGYEYICSVCEKGIRQYEGQPICSECGAKMDGRSDTH